MEDVNKRRRIFLSLFKLDCGRQEINAREIRLYLTFSADWNKRECLFKVTFFAPVAVFDAKARYCPFFTIFFSWRGLSPLPSAKWELNLTIDNLFRVLAVTAIFLLKVVVEWWWLFPAKMTLVHVRALLYIELALVVFRRLIYRPGCSKLG